MKEIIIGAIVAVGWKCYRPKGNGIEVVTFIDQWPRAIDRKSLWWIDVSVWSYSKTIDLLFTELPYLPSIGFCSLNMSCTYTGATRRAANENYTFQYTYCSDSVCVVLGVVKSSCLVGIFLRLCVGLGCMHITHSNCAHTGFTLRSTLAWADMRVRACRMALPHVFIYNFYSFCIYVLQHDIVRSATYEFGCVD